MTRTFRSQGVPVVISIPVVVVISVVTCGWLGKKVAAVVIPILTGGWQGKKKAAVVISILTGGWLGKMCIEPRCRVPITAGVPGESQALVRRGASRGSAAPEVGAQASSGKRSHQSS